MRESKLKVTIIALALPFFVALAPVVSQAKPATLEQEMSFAKQALLQLAQSEGYNLEDSSITLTPAELIGEKVFDFIMPREFDKVDLVEKWIIFSATDSSGAKVTKRALLVANSMAFDNNSWCPVLNNTTKILERPDDKQYCMGLAFGRSYSGVRQDISTDNFRARMLLIQMSGAMKRVQAQFDWT